MPHLHNGTRIALASVAFAIALIAASACGSSDADPKETSVPTLSANATPLERLTAAYNDPNVDPSSDAWAALLADPGFATKPISVVEFVSLKNDGGALTAYNGYIDALTAAINDAGAEMLSVNDVLMPGLEGLDSYDGGVSWIATFPTISAYVDVMLDERTIAAAQARRGAIAEAHVLAGPNLLPELITKQLPDNAPASDFPRDHVLATPADDLVEELLAVYPSGGADPTRETLEAMFAYEGFADQRVHFINLYRFKDGGAESLGEYNQGAFPVVVAHGGRPKALVDITHQLVGPIEWDRFIFVSWASLATFTQLRLEPQYLEAQKDRVVSGEQYGNLINIARADKLELIAEN
jgi:uncharacterized protein (DUF1330 family)